MTSYSQYDILYTVDEERKTQKQNVAVNTLNTRKEKNMAEKTIGKYFTTREFLSAVINGELDKVSTNGQTIVAKAEELLAAIDKRLAANKEKPKKPTAHVDNSVEKTKIAEYLATLGDKPAIAKDISLGVDMTVQKTTAVIRQMVEDGTVERIDAGRNKPLEYKLHDGIEKEEKGE